MRFAALLMASLIALGGCNRTDPNADRPETAREFPRAERAVSGLGSNQFSTETERDSVGEAQRVMDLAEIKPGMTVADIGAGEGYYTVRLAEKVGAKGRVLAEDIDRDALDRLGQRVERERLDNVSIRLGTPDDPRLPPASFDRIFLVHVYHEVQNPYAFLWHLRDGLKTNGEIVVVDADRPANRHGLPPARLACEFAALNLKPTMHAVLAGGDAYLTTFTIGGPRPAPAAIKACGGSG